MTHGASSEHGSGPGPITPDGSAVELYALLPPMGEPEVVHAAIPAGASVLELGAGAGRVTHQLVELGHPVVAVDESPEMLTRIRGAAPGAPADARPVEAGSTSAGTASAGMAPTPTGTTPTPTATTPTPTGTTPTPTGQARVGVETVRARIQDLDLMRRFDAVLLASFLVNTPDDELRRGFLAACRDHLRDGGCVLVQRHPPGWFDEATEGERTRGGVIFRLRDLRRPGPGLLAATAEYQVGERVWTHTFTARRLDDGELAAALAEAGLVVDAYLTGDGSWVRAVPASRGDALGRSPR
jgi:SAM-dependent methyltransferase